MNHLGDINSKQLAQGISGRYIHGELSTVGIVEIAAGSILPLHHHVHEQITYILEGELEMTIGGVTMVLTPGCYHVIPTNTPHSAVALTACKVMDVFSPVRQEYK